MTTLTGLATGRCENLGHVEAYRIESLRGYLKELNTGQGLGFVIFGVVSERAFPG